MENAKTVNLNADMGESYGRYVLGNDEALIPFVATIHVACGYHAADPGTMLRSVQLAKRFDVELGAHISYPDLMGFGRRRMGLSENEVFEISVYQVGALLGFCRAEGIALNHVKPHGQLYLTGVRDRATARGIVRAVKAVDPELILLMAGDIVADECADAGVRMVQEGYVDLEYAPDGSLVLERAKMSRDPEIIAARTIALLEQQGREAIDGSWLKIQARSICVHGDSPNAPDIARAVRERMIAVGYRIVGLRELVGGATRPASRSRATSG
jgi:5-oxoprolinase (ATP-hydrolysing) subunit A